MTGTLGDIALGEELTLVHVGVIGFLRFRIFGRLGPAQKMRHRAFRPVAVEDFQAQSARRQIVRDLGQGLRRLGRQQAEGLFIAVDRATDEIVAAEIAHLDHEARHHRRRIDKGRRALPLRLGRQADDQQ